MDRPQDLQIQRIPSLLHRLIVRRYGKIQEPIPPAAVSPEDVRAGKDRQYSRPAHDNNGAAFEGKPSHDSYIQDDLCDGSQRNHIRLLVRREQCPVFRERVKLQYPIYTEDTEQAEELSVVQLSCMNEERIRRRAKDDHAAEKMSRLVVQVFRCHQDAVHSIRISGGNRLIKGEYRRPGEPRFQECQVRNELRDRCHDPIHFRAEVHQHDFRDDEAGNHGDDLQQPRR